MLKGARGIHDTRDDEPTTAMSSGCMASGMTFKKSLRPLAAIDSSERVLSEGDIERKTFPRREKRVRG